MTTFIFISSVGHAAANFGQYDQYAFPPNYPSVLHGERPKNKVGCILAINVYNGEKITQYGINVGDY